MFQSSHQIKSWVLSICQNHPSRALKLSIFSTSCLRLIWMKCHVSNVGMDEVISCFLMKLFLGQYSWFLKHDFKAQLLQSKVFIVEFYSFSIHHNTKYFLPLSPNRNHMCSNNMNQHSTLSINSYETQFSFCSLLGLRSVSWPL